MMSCCSIPVDLCRQFNCKVEEIDKGISVSFTSDDKAKAEALKNLVKSYRALGGDECCGPKTAQSCC